MNLGLLLPLGDSLTSYAKHGQDVRFVKYYLRHYCQKFDKVFLFSYKKEKYPGLPTNCILVVPETNIHRYLYGLLLPLLKAQEYQQCDIFRCFHPSAAIPAIVGKMLFSKKFVFNYNYDYVAWAKIEGKSYLSPWLKISQWLAFRFCDGVFVADEKMEKYARQFVGPTKITIIRNGVDINLFRLRKRAHEGKVILSVGRLEPQKNYGQLIEAVAKIKGRVKLIIVGRGQLRQELIGLARRKGVDLQIIDVVSHNKLPKIYQAADVYVQPSLAEAPVKTLLEAMSCGLPCVATNVAGICDIIVDKESGLLAKLDSDDIAREIGTVLENPALARKLGSSARQLIVKKYDLLKILDIETRALLSL